MKKQSLKSRALDFVEKRGFATSTEIKKFMYELTHPNTTYDPVKNRGWYCSYFSASGYGPTRKEALLMTPSKNDNRILKRENDGRYTVMKLKENMPNSDMKIIYEVDMKSAEITPVEVYKWDKSYYLMNNVFDDEDAAEAFAEGIIVPAKPVTTKDESDDELDNALENIENDIAETYISESTINSVNDLKETIETERHLDSVPILLNLDSIIYNVEYNHTVTFSKEIVKEINIIIKNNTVDYKFKCESGFKFMKSDLGLTVFTDKAIAFTRLNELL